MIKSPEDLASHSAADFERLPEEGHWEVADGRAVLLPGNDLDHQEICDGLIERLLVGLNRRGYGKLVSTVNVDIPGDEFRTRVPDIVVYERRPSGNRLHAGAPPEIPVCVLATRRRYGDH